MSPDRPQGWRRIRNDVEFPADFRNDQLAGKTAKVSFKIVKVQEPKLPEVDAEFVKLFGITDGDLDNLPQGSARQSRARTEGSVDGRLKSQVAEKLANATANSTCPT
jgi:trigger factor